MAFKYVYSLLIYICVLFQCNSNANASIIPVVDEDPVIRNGECGGTVELDRGTIVYPGDGAIQPGELCVWTVHLKTMDGFRMNFTHLNLPGGNSSCYRSAVGIHGLSNLIPRDDLESYRLCNENNNVGNYFLTSNIATIVFYASSSFQPNGSSTGFSIHWEGSRFQPIPTEHTSTYSISPSGVVWYPFEGEYPPNAGMTWQVKGVRSSDPVPNPLDIDVIFVDLENCSLQDKCLCDALIIYDVSPVGQLHEIDRFCGDKTSGQYQNVNTDFIVAFYTDSVNTPQSGYGFQVVWRQGTVGSTTVGTTPQSTTLGESTTGNWWTTTEDWTTPQGTTEEATTPQATTEEWRTTTEDWWITTEDWWTTTEEGTTPQATTGDYTTGWDTTSEDYWETSTGDPWSTTYPPAPVEPCGGIIEGDYGTISYKNGERYENNVRCIWTIRLSPPYTEMGLTLFGSGFELGSDYISVFSFTHKNDVVRTAHLGQSSNGYQNVNLNGSVAIVVFSSDYSVQGTGFTLDFYARGSRQQNISYFYDQQNHDVIHGSLRYPANSTYQSNELDTFVITNGYGYGDPNEYVGLYLYSYHISNATLEGSCHVGNLLCACDGLLIFELDSHSLRPLTPALCGTSEELAYFRTSHTYVIVFYTNDWANSDGFYLQWNKNLIR